MPRAKKSEREIQEMRSRILDAASALLQQEGPAGVSIRKIADQIDVSHMLLYSYFNDQGAIINALRERAFSELVSFCADLHSRAEHGDAFAELTAFLRRFICFVQRHPNVNRLAWRHGRAAQVDSQNVAEVLEHLSRIIALCIERGQCMPRDPKRAAAMVFAMVTGTLVAYVNIPALEQSVESHLEDELIETAIAYLTKQPTQVKAPEAGKMQKG